MLPLYGQHTKFPTITERTQIYQQVFGLDSTGIETLVA
jgi:hypothetical protein